MNLNGIRVIITDFDETVSYPKARVPERVLTFLKKFKTKHNLKLFLVSGRSFDFLLKINKRLDGGGFVAENGNIVYTKKGGKLKFKDGSYITKLFPKRHFQVKESIVEFDKNYLKKAIKILSKADIKYDQEWNNRRLMIMPRGTSKIKGLTKLLKRFNLSFKDAISFGNGENDICYLKKSKISVAVANSPLTVKKKADFITKKPYGDGVIEFLRRFNNDKKNNLFL